MIEIVLQREGKIYKPFSDADADAGLIYPEHKPLRAKITGAVKARAYRELCCYMGSCEYIASLNLNENMNTKIKVDYMTRIKRGFVVDTIYDEKTRRVHWIPESLCYNNCDQPRAHQFISAALEEHAFLVGLTVEDYIEKLKGGHHG